MEITQFSPPDYFKEEAQSNGMHYVSEWRFIAEGNKTTVSIDFSGYQSNPILKEGGLCYGTEKRICCSIITAICKS